jgi:hypothetical protein
VSRDPISAEVNDILRLVEAAGSVAELRRWVKLARAVPRKPKSARGPGRRKNVPAFGGDTTLLLYAAALQMHYPKLETFAAIREVVETTWCLTSGADADIKMMIRDSVKAKQNIEFADGLEDQIEAEVTEVKLIDATTGEETTLVDHDIAKLVDGGPLGKSKSVKRGRYRRTLYGAHQQAHAKRLLAKLGGRSLAEFCEENCADPAQSPADKYAMVVIDKYRPRFIPGMGWMWCDYRGSVLEESPRLPTESKLPKPSVLLIRRQSVSSEAT